MKKILVIKTVILFASFFAFFVFFAPLAQADTECSPPFDYVGSASACLGCWQLNADVCMDNNSPPPNKYCYNINRYGSTCTIDNTTTTGTCDESANCIESCTPSWSCGDWSPPDGECGETLNQTRTCTDSNSCGTTDGKPDESQTSYGTYCSNSYGAWSACSDSYTDSCDTAYSGTQSRTVTSNTCSDNACGSGSALPNETQNCSETRNVDTNLTSTACTSDTNACGATNPGFVQCNDACSASVPANPSTCQNCNNVGECGTLGYSCPAPTGCTAGAAPADKTFSVTSVSASPSSGAPPLNNVAVTADVAGTATGGIVYKLDCTNDGVFEQTTSSITTDPYTFTTKCSYASAGTYTVKVTAVRQTLSASASTTVTVSSDTTPPTVTIGGAPSAWQKTDAAATIGCSDTNGCEVNTSWRFYTPSSNPGSCSTTLADYTGSYENYIAAGFVVNTHIWVCATAKDASTGANRGYSAPVEFKVDEDGPTATIGAISSVAPLAAGVWLSRNADGSDKTYAIPAADSDNNGSGLKNCFYNVWDNSVGWTKFSQPRTCNSTFSVSVGPTGDCRTEGLGTCVIDVFATDQLDNEGAYNSKTISIGPWLTFPLGTWQRLWYNNPLDNNFINASFIGEDAIDNIDKDWGGDPLYGAQKDTIGFKASRTLTGLTPGAYTILIGADDGIKLFVNGSDNLLPSSAWSSNHSWEDNKHNVRVELASTAKIEIHYRENASNAKITFAYNLGVVLGGNAICTTGLWTFEQCGETPVPYYPPCDFYEEGGICYYDSSTTGCGAVVNCSGSVKTCSYNSMCTLQPGQSCVSQGCAEGTPPNVTINTPSGQWYNSNSLLDVDATDNVALQGIRYQIDSYTADQSGTAATSDGSSALAVGGTSVTADWEIATADWNGLSEGSHTIYVKAIGTSGICKGCDGSKSLTIKKDTAVPSITVGEIKRTSPDVQVITNNWFKAGIYEISMSVNDPNGANGSGADTSYGPVIIRSRGDDDTFDTPDDKTYPTDWIGDNKFNVWVGPDDDPSHPDNNVLNDCVNEEEERCRIEVYARDLAGNEKVLFPYPAFNIDYTPPTAQ